jgi:hypothetical protein
VFVGIVLRINQKGARLVIMSVDKNMISLT